LLEFGWAQEGKVLMSITARGARCWMRWVFWLVDA